MGLFTPCAQKSIRRCLVLFHLTRNAGKAVTMSGGLDVLQMKEEDVLKFLAASTHLGGTNMDFQMEQYVNIPTIALCNTDSPLRYVDIAIPCNNKGHHSVGLMWWMLAREVLRMRGTISREHPWEVMPDLYFYRDPEEIEKEEQAAADKAVGKEEFQGGWTAPAAEFTQPEVADWSEGVAVPSVPIQQFPAATSAAAAAAAPAKPAAGETFSEDWSAQTATEDWSAAPTAQASDWGGATADWS